MNIIFFLSVDSYIQMKKHSDLSLSTERILKSKYLDKQKQKTVPVMNRGSKKITLVDLCQEEKIKIGELIKTLQTRKRQNQVISEQYNNLSCQYELCSQKLIEVEQRLLENENKYQQILLVLKTKDLTIKDQEDTIHRFEDEIQNYKEAVKKLRQRSSHVVATQTENQVVDVCVQTKRKKIKNRHCQVQMETISPERNVFYRAHSKSFDKIMKGPFPQEKCFSQSVQESAATEKYTKKKEKSSGFQDKNSPDINNFEEEAEECVQSLAKRWKEIKQRSERTRNPCVFNKSVQRHQGDVLEQSGEEDDSDQDRKREVPNQIEDYDEKYLNKLLKMKNFSASRLMKGNHNSSISKSGSKKHSPEISYLKSPYFNEKEGIRSSHNSSNYHTQQVQLSTDQNINFFQSDILELAERINI